VRKTGGRVGLEEEELMTNRVKRAN
jgi:hypothetical protein